MSFLRPLAVAFALSSCLGCQLGYYMHSAYHQSKLANSRKPLEKVLRSSDLNEEQKNKLHLVQEAKKFAESNLGLKTSRNYTTFVQLDEPYVTYIVQASTDLQTWGTSGVIQNTIGQQLTATYSTAGHPKVFLRLNVTQP